MDVFNQFERRGDVQRAVIHRGYKLVTREYQHVAAASDWDYFLYDIENDPTEQVDIARQHPSEVLRLVRLIARWERLHPPDGTRWFWVRPSTIDPLLDQLLLSLRRAG